MSTVFAVAMHTYSPEVDEHGCLIVPEDEYSDGYDKYFNELVPIAHRTSQGCTTKGDFYRLLHLFKPETRVYPIGNSPQGIYTIADILKELID